MREGGEPPAAARWRRWHAPPPSRTAAAVGALADADARPPTKLCSAERRDGGGFVTGFVLGGVVFGALGFLFAPQARGRGVRGGRRAGATARPRPPRSRPHPPRSLQISAALLSEDQRLKLPRFLEEEERTPEETKQVQRKEWGGGPGEGRAGGWQAATRPLTNHGFQPSPSALDSAPFPVFPGPG